MSLYTVGGVVAEATFNRTFFNVTLGEILERGARTGATRVTLFLLDGTTLDVLNIDELSDRYLIANAYKGEETCEACVHLVPYGLIYRIEISPKLESDGRRMGFRWKRSVG